MAQRFVKLVLVMGVALTVPAAAAHAGNVRATGAKAVTSRSAVLTARMTCDPCRWQWRWRRIGASRWTRSRTYRAARHAGRVSLRVVGLESSTLYRYRLCLARRCVGERWWTRATPLVTVAGGGGSTSMPPRSPTPTPFTPTTSPTTSALVIPTSKLGVNVSTFNAQGGLKTVLGIGKAAPNGLGVVRFEMVEGTNSVLTAGMDTAVKYYANRGLAIYAMLGIGDRTSPNGFVADSQTLDTYATQFMKRFGTNGTFWAENPAVPYHPVTQVEIGNEPNSVPPLVADNSGMHYKSAGAFAYVYAHARAAIKAVRSGARVIVGGLAPLDFSTVKSWLASFLDSSYTTAVDSVGWHPYMMNDNANEPHTVAAVEQDTNDLHQVEISHGYPNAKIDLNEFDSSLATTGTSDAWGKDVAAITYWALCLRGDFVADVQPEWWGGLAGADSNVFLPLAHDDGTLADYGKEYLAEVHQLTSTGCPA